MLVKRFQHNRTRNGAYNGITAEVFGIILFGLIRAPCLDNGVGSMVGDFRTTLKHLPECRKIKLGDLLVYLSFDKLFILRHKNIEKGLHVAAVHFDLISNAASKGPVLRMEAKPVYNQMRSMHGWRKRE
jgi:hypothetical protein